MLARLRRLFGIRPPSAARLTVEISGRNPGTPAACPARLVARDAAGASLLSCTVQVGTGRSLAARPGQPSTAHDFPEGDYTLDAVSGGMLHLQPRVGERTPPPERSRQALLVHGSVPPAPADGSVRMDDADLARLIALLPDRPDDPDHFLVRLFPPTDLDAGDADPAGNDASWSGTERPREADAPGLTPVLLAPDPGTPADQAAAQALAVLGYAVLSEQAVNATDLAAVAVTAEAGTPDAAWTPAPGEYGG